MCGRFSLHEQLSMIEDLYEAQAEADVKEPDSFNIAPSQRVPIIRNDDHGRVIELMKWGLVPIWAKDPKVGFKMINARDDTIKSKPTYRSAFKNRCIVPASGFYEWKGEKGSKQPYFIFPSEGIFSFAGMWESWTPKDDSGAEPLHTFTIVTTSANRFMSDLHSRMPVILAGDDIDIWMDNKSEKEELYDLMKPFDGEMKAYPVSTAVNNVRNQGKELIQPLPGGDKE